MLGALGIGGAGPTVALRLGAGPTATMCAGRVCCETRRQAAAVRKYGSIEVDGTGAAAVWRVRRVCFT